MINQLLDFKKKTMNVLDDICFVGYYSSKCPTDAQIVLVAMAPYFLHILTKT